MKKGEIRMVRQGHSVWDRTKQHKILVETDTLVQIEEIPERNDDIVHVKPVHNKESWSVYYSKTLPA